MPVLPLKPFLAYKQNEFRIGGNPAEVFEFARRWRVFAENALTTAASLRAINDGGFLGDEGDRYRELIHGEFPNHLTITGEAHRGVSTAVTQYAEALTSAQTQMNALTAIAMVDHTAVQTAVANYNLCEANVVRAAATAKVATATAVATAALPGVNETWLIWESLYIRSLMLIDNGAANNKQYVSVMKVLCSYFLMGGW